MSHVRPLKSQTARIPASVSVKMAWRSVAATPGNRAVHMGTLSIPRSVFFTSTCSPAQGSDKSAVEIPIITVFPSRVNCAACSRKLVIWFVGFPSRRWNRGSLGTSSTPKKKYPLVARFGTVSTSPVNCAAASSSAWSMIPLSLQPAYRK